MSGQIHSADPAVILGRKKLVIGDCETCLCASVAAGAANSQWVNSWLKGLPFYCSSHTLVCRVVFERTRSSFRPGGLLKAPHSSSLGKVQMEILITDGGLGYF